MLENLISKSAVELTTKEISEKLVETKLDAFEANNNFKEENKLEAFEDKDDFIGENKLGAFENLDDKSRKVDREYIKEDSGYSDKIVENINSNEEYQIYKDANLIESEINDKPVLIREINLTEKDSMGRTNKERMELGLAPLENGKPIELHHIGQKEDSPLAELTTEQHRGRGNDTVLHDKIKESEIDRNSFNTEKIKHWKERVEKVENQNE